MNGASIRGGVAALCILLSAAKAEAAHYVLAATGMVQWAPPKFPATVVYTDVLSGGFDVDDGSDGATLGSGLTAFSINVVRQTDYRGPTLNDTNYATFSYGLADLDRFAFDPSDLLSPINFSLNSGSMTALTGAHIFTFGAISGEPQTHGALTVTLAAVPEPASWAMMVAGFGLVGWAIRGRARRRDELFA